jgi:hypothetical protein
MNKGMRNLAYAMAIKGPCVICDKEITIHDMRGDQIIVANDGGSKQAHRYCWENRESEDQPSDNRRDRKQLYKDYIKVIGGKTD